MSEVSVRAALAPTLAWTDRHERILQAAMACFGRWGVPRTRMEDIATEAGVARPVLYRYFPGKDALQLAVMVRHIEERAAALHARNPPEGPAGNAILQALLAGILAPSTDRVSESVLAPEAVRHTAALVASSPEIMAAMSAYWEPYLHHAAARGELREGVAITDAVRWLTTVVFCYLTLPEVSPPPGALEDQLRTFVVDAIITPSSGPS